MELTLTSLISTRCRKRFRRGNENGKDRKSVLIALERNGRRKAVRVLNDEWSAIGSFPEASLGETEHEKYIYILIYIYIKEGPLRIYAEIFIPAAAILYLQLG